MDDINPLFSKPVTAYIAPAPSPATSPSSSKRRPSAATQRIIQELSFRFPPSSKTDIDDREALLALLCSDLIDVPTKYLELAAVEWARTKAWMPKASELINLSRNFLEKPRTDANSHEGTQKLADT